MNIVEFAEKIFGIELLECQKQLLLKFATLPPNAKLCMGIGGRIFFVPGPEPEVIAMDWQNDIYDTFVNDSRN